MLRNLRWTALLAVFAIGSTACSDDGPSGPSGTDFDPVTAEQATENLQARLDSDSDMLVSLELASEGLSLAGGTFSVVTPERLDQPVTPLSARVVYSSMMASSMEPIFPSNLLGVTFEWGAAEGHYVPTERAGAPADGIRFILYAIDPLTRRPAEPLTETGFLDLTDEGDASATRLGIYAESGGEALVDYFIEMTYQLLGEQDLSATLTAEGYISDGTERLNFELDEMATVLGSTQMISVDVDYVLSLAGEDVSVETTLSTELDLSGEGSIEVATAGLTIRNGSDVAVLSMELAADNTLSGVLTYNGEPALYVSGTEGDPVFERADGEPLTSEDVAALLQLYDLLGDVFDLGEHLFEPFGGSPVSI
jgi:hypothetical protein